MTTNFCVILGYLQFFSEWLLIFEMCALVFAEKLLVSSCSFLLVFPGTQMFKVTHKFIALYSSKQVSTQHL